jgi:hypothetical protein
MESPSIGRGISHGYWCEKEWGKLSLRDIVAGILTVIALLFAIGGAFLTQSNTWGGIAVIIIFGGGFAAAAAWVKRG